MPRTPRKQSVSGIHHVMARGIDKRNIFLKEGDYSKFLSILLHTQQKYPLKIYAYCLMCNHFHLLVQPQVDELGTAIQRITTAYAVYHNQTHQRFGHLFQNRFKSEPIDGDEQFLTVLRYIHQNPIKAQLVDDMRDYPWSSFHVYAGNSSVTSNASLVATDFARDLVGNSSKLLEFFEIPTEHKCLDIGITAPLDDAELNFAIQSIISIEGLHELPKNERDNFLRLIKSKTGASNRRLAQILDISPRLLDRILR